MDDFWNKRYKEKGYAYGTEPNQFFREKMLEIPAGKILLPAEGEGRNAVFAAKKGWEVSAFDQSIEAQKKAEIWAFQNNVRIEYDLETMGNINYKPNYFDVVALIFAHFPKGKRKEYYSQLSTYLKKGGLLIMECFSEKHVYHQKDNLQSGGPKDASLLCSLEETKSELIGFDFIETEDKEILLEEGIYHVGKANVIRILAVKR